MSSADDRRLEETEVRMEIRNAFRDESRFGRSMHATRLKYSRTGSTNRERAFAKVWFKRYDPWIFSASWSSKLGALLTPITRDPHRGDAHFVTKREAEVAATVIQWLGTNVGFVFLEEALKEAGYAVQKVENK